MQSKLSRHIFRKHKNEELVKSAAGKSVSAKRNIMTQLRREGIYEHNKKFISHQSATFLRERRMSRKRVLRGGLLDETKLTKICSRCKGVFDKDYMRKHRKICSVAAGSTVGVDLSMSVLRSVADCGMNNSEFSRQILCKFRDDECGMIVKKDRMILEVGQYYFDNNPKKQRHIVMTHMRRLGLLLMKFRDVTNTDLATGADMLDPAKENFDKLCEAIDCLCTTSEGQSKSNLRLAVVYLLIRAAKVMQGYYLVSNEKANEVKVKDFGKVLCYKRGKLVGDSLYRINMRRLETLRKPGEMPTESDLAKLRAHCQEVMAKLSDVYKKLNVIEFRRLRAATVTRLTVYNARRGSEPARLEMKEWKVAEASGWLDKETARARAINIDESEMIGKFKLAYQSGKGNVEEVPTLIPKDCEHAILKLIAEREAVGISKLNKYIFPYTQGSIDHVIGWKEMKTMCAEAKVEFSNLITANKVRHRAATIHAGLAVSSQQKQAFLRHIGHSQKVDERVYQCPTAVAEMCLVGKFLDTLDNGRVDGK